MKKIAWVLRLVPGVELLVKNGLGIKEGEVVYKNSQGLTMKYLLPFWMSLTIKEREQLRQKVVGKKLEKGEVLWKKGWLRPKVIRSPEAGICRVIDELGNMEISGGGAEVYKSPVTSKKLRVSKDKIIFELRGWEKKAEGISQTKGWCDFSEVVILEGEGVVVEKAEAMGAKGIILMGVGEVEDEWRESTIPMVAMKRNDVDDLIKLSKDRSNSKLWINPISGRVILC